MYHCSPRKDFTPAISETQTLCLADDADVARMYRRGGDVAHYLFSANIGEANIASENELTEIVESLGWTMEKFDEQPYIAMKNAKVRTAILAAGFDGVEYEDTHEGCNYMTTELLAMPADFSLELVEEVLCDE